MAMQVKVGQFVKGGAGSQAVTGIGFQPKAVIFFGNAGHTGPSFAGNINLWVGFTSGAAESFCVSTYSQNGVNPSNTSRRIAAKAITVVDNGESVIVEADLTSFDVDGFTLNWSGASLSTQVMNYIALGGTDLTNAKVVQWTEPTAAGDKTVTGVGFKPDLVMTATAFRNLTIPYSSDVAAFSFGVMDKDGNQWVNGFKSRDAISPTDTQHFMFTDACVMDIDYSMNVTSKGSFKSMNNDGFTTNHTSVSTVAIPIVSLCLKGGSYKVGNAFKSGSTGKQRLDGVGFEPKGLLISSEGASQARNGASASSLWSLGAASSPADEKGIAIRDRDSVATSSVQGYQADKILTLLESNNPSSTTGQADLDSFDDDGFTLNWTSNWSDQLVPFVYLAFGDTPASSTKGLKVKVGSFAKPAGAGSQSITGIGFQPKAIIFYGSSWNTANGFITSQAGAFLGFTTGATESFCVSATSDNNVASSDTERRMAAKAISAVRAGPQQVMHEADLTSFDADGFTLNWTTVNRVEAFIINYIALGGDDLTTAKAIKWDKTAASSQDVTTVGFKPDCVLHAFSGYDVSTTLPATHTFAELGFGVMDKYGNQWSTSYWSYDALNPSDTSRSQSSALALQRTNPGLSMQGFAFAAMLSNGFRVTTVNWSAGQTTPVISLCLKGGSYKVGNFTKGTGTAPVYQSVGGAGFQPKGMLFSAMRETALASVTQAVWSLGAASNAASAKVMAIQDRDAVTPTIARGYQADKAVVHPSESPGTILAEAGLASFDNNGFTLNWTTNDANAYQTFYLAFGDAVVEDTTLDAGTKVKVGSFLKKTSLGLQQVTGIGFRPKALILYGLRTENNGFQDIQGSLGFAAGGGKQYSVGFDSWNAVNPSEVSRRMSNKVFSMVYGHDQTTAAEASLLSFDADGFTIDWTTMVYGAASIVNYIAIGGIDTEEANVVKWNVSAAGGSQVVTGVGFQPGLVMHAGYGNQSATIPNSSTTFAVGIGAMDSSGNQWATSLRGSDAVNPSDTWRCQRTDVCYMEIFNSSATNITLTYTSMDADGFTVLSTTSHGVLHPVISLCIKGPAFKVGSFAKDTGTAPDAQSVTGVGFQPKGIILSSVKNGANPTPAAHSLWSFGAASGATDERGIALRDEDNVSPTDAQGYQNSYTLTLLDSSGVSTVTDQLDLTSFDADGFSGNWITNSAVAHEILYIAIGDANSAPNAPTLDSPAEGAVLYSTQSNTFQFDATDPNAGDTMSAWALKVTIQGTTRWWNATTNSWSATEHFNTEGSPPSFPVTDKQVVVGANEFDDFFA